MLLRRKLVEHYRLQRGCRCSRGVYSVGSHADPHCCMHPARSMSLLSLWLMSSIQLHGQRSASRGPADSSALYLNWPDGLADWAPRRPASRPMESVLFGLPVCKRLLRVTVLIELALNREPSKLEGLTFRPRFADSGALTRVDAERPELTSWERQLTMPSASTYDAHDMPALSSSLIWHATRKHGFYHSFAITLDLSLLLRTLGK
ncbi:unnamed protein product [Polarella glacialis]|uniref:Uncharacterized protein n=1 Tax=Polarella glacialis TaxID=89957 RepID=A0A813F6M3_POLGL|nr:unnamed protein product [Polarella glacialis]